MTPKKEQLVTRSGWSRLRCCERNSVLTGAFKVDIISEIPTTQYAITTKKRLPRSIQKVQREVHVTLPFEHSPTFN